MGHKIARNVEAIAASGRSRSRVWRIERLNSTKAWQLNLRDM